jgi:hypothetical protein
LYFLSPSQIQSRLNLKALRAGLQAVLEKSRAQLNWREPVLLQPLRSRRSLEPRVARPGHLVARPVLDRRLPVS